MADAAESTALLNGPVLPAWFGPDNIVRFQVVPMGLFLPGYAEPAVVLPFVFGLTVLGVVPGWWDLAFHVLTIGAFGTMGYFVLCRMVIVSGILDTKIRCGPRPILLPLFLGAGVAGWLVRPQLSLGGHADRLRNLCPDSRYNRISSCRWSDGPLVNQAGKAGRAGIQQQDQVTL